EPLPEHVDEIVVVTLDQPSRADRIVVELVWFRRRVPTLHDAIVSVPRRQIAVGLEPGPFNQIAALWHRGLLILRREPLAAHIGFDLVQNHLRLTLGVQRVADTAAMELAGGDLDLLRYLGYGGQTQLLPTALLQHMADEVIDMKALGDQDDDIIG